MVPTPPVSKLLRRLRSREEGIALVAALGMSVVLGIVGATAVAYSSTNYGAASRSKADTNSLTLAEAGVNNALAVLTLPTNNPFNPYLLPARTTSYGGGSVTWSGTLDESTGVWTVSAVGRTRNPTGPAATDVQRKVTVKVPVTPYTTASLQTDAWNYIYERSRGAATGCDENISNSVAVGSPMYVTGNLCLNNSATVTKGPLLVKGQVTMNSNQNAIGSSSTPLNELHVGNGCKWTSNSLHNPCQQGSGSSGKDNVWANAIDNTPATIASPVPAWSTWYLNASPGPYYPCNTSSGTPPSFDNDQGARSSPDASKRNNSLASVQDLTPGASYTCRTDTGELSWDAGTRVLTVKGTIFIDGSAKVYNALVNSYSGQSSIYLSGTLLIKNSDLCAVLTADGATCTSVGWNPNNRLLVFVANGNGSWGGAAAQVATGDSIQVVNSYFQGALYGTNAVDLDTTSVVDGPLNGSTVKLGQSVSSSFPAFSIVPEGMPGESVVYGTVNPPTDFSG